MGWCFAEYLLKHELEEETIAAFGFLDSLGYKVVDLLLSELVA
jgi:hypothetical protein